MLSNVRFVLFFCSMWMTDWCTISKWFRSCARSAKSSIRGSCTSRSRWPKTVSYLLFLYTRYIQVSRSCFFFLLRIYIPAACLFIHFLHPRIIIVFFPLHRGCFSYMLPIAACATRFNKTRARSRACVFSSCYNVLADIYIYILFVWACVSQIIIFSVFYSFF